jgi:hypothetical protein
MGEETETLVGGADEQLGSTTLLARVPAKTAPSKAQAHGREALTTCGRGGSAVQRGEACRRHALACKLRAHAGRGGR